MTASAARLTQTLSQIRKNRSSRFTWFRPPFRASLGHIGPFDTLAKLALWFNLCKEKPDEGRGKPDADARTRNVGHAAERCQSSRRRAGARQGLASRSPRGVALRHEAAVDRVRGAAGAARARRRRSEPLRTG